jgi:ankyrin repeat protein
MACVDVLISTVNMVIVNCLHLQSGADIDAKTSSGVTALWLAAGEGREDVVRYYIV